MNLLVAKLALCSTAGVGSVVAVGFGVNHVFKHKTQKGYAVVAKLASSGQQAQTAKNYQCRISDVVEDCSISVLKFDAAKHWLKTSALPVADSEESIAFPTATPDYSFYKVVLGANLFAKLPADLSNKSIEVVTKDANAATSTALASLKPLITVDNNTTFNYDKSTFIVSGGTLLAGDDSSKTGVFDSTKTHWCSFSANTTSGISPQQCKLSVFGAASAFEDSTVFSQNTTEASSPIEASKIYLVTFTNDAGGIAKTDITSGHQLLFEEASDTNTKKPIAQFSTITPALVVNVDATNKAILVIK